MKYLVLWMSVVISLPVVANVNLESAYKREYIFLVAQKTELKKQKENLTKLMQKNIGKAKRSLDALQEKLIALNSKNEKMSETIYKIEQNLEKTQEGSSVLDSTKKQAQLSLGIKDEKTTLSLEELFKLKLQRLLTSSDVKKMPGLFFLENGEQVKGEILSMGQIASFGHHAQSFYMLAPAGNGQLKVWKPLKNGEQIFKGQMPEVFSAFLYENLDREITKKKQQTLLGFLKAGGTIGWVIVVMGLIALCLSLFRAFHLRGYSKAALAVENSVKQYSDKNLTERLDRLKGSMGPKEFIIKLFQNKNHSKELIDDVIEEGLIHEHKLIDRCGALILVFATVAPLMGLLGTVTGMISTFDVITEHGTGDPKLLSQGISEALITTELGLIVAIPALLIGNVLSGWGKNVKMNLEKLILNVTGNLK